MTSGQLIKPTIPRRRVAGGPAPLSFAQEGVWLADQLRPGEPTYTMPMALRLRGHLVRSALAGALTDVVARHPALRTTVVAPEGQPVQLVHPTGAPVLTTTDLSSLPAAERYPEALRRADQEARRPLDPARAVLRTRLYRLDADDHLLFLAVHHIVWDGWSISVFYRDLSEFYRRRTVGGGPDLPELPIEYADYATWQREQPGPASLAADLEYWRAELAGGVLPLELPSARPPDPTDRGAAVARHLVPADTLASMSALARAERVSPFMVLTTALHAVLHRLTGVPSVNTSFASANRDRAELEDLIGLFVNQLVLRTDCADDPTFRDLLRQVRTKTLRAFRHAALPYESLVRDLGLGTDPNADLLGQVRLGYQNATDSSLLWLPGLDTEVIDLHSGASREKLDLVATEQPEGLDLAAVYATGRFDELSVTRLLHRLARTTAAGCAEPDLPLSRLPLLVEDEAVELVRAGSAERSAEPDDTVAGTVRAQIARTPGAVALVDGERTVTYAELGERVRALSAVLHEHGVRPGDAVAVHLERSVDFVVTALALFDRAAHYVPLDPGLPQARSEFMLADTAPVLVVTADADTDFPVPTLVLEPGWHDRVDPPDVPAAELRPGDCAYVMYTSGSTGRPKGAMVPHSGVVNIARHHQRLVPLGPGDRVLHSASLAFDLSVVQLYWPLATGATVVIAPSEATADVRALTALARKEQVTVVSMVPSVLSTYLAADPPPLPALRVVFAAGEALGTELVRRTHRYAPVPVINCYGPTEATVIAVMWELRPEDELPATIPIGRPVTGVRCHVLDAELRPVPLGAVGELYLGGAGVSAGSGYFRRPRLTAERYVPDPFGEPGGRLYRTGDLVRLYGDGTLYYLGRADRQLKLNGVRMEPGEIQAVLEEHPDVADSYVTVRDERLVAYVVGRGGRVPAEADLHTAASAALPRQMVPSRFVVLDRMPLTPNGKLDTDALPEPDSRATAERAFVEPRTPTERVVAAGMAEVLGLERVGATDDYFLLGGTSLQAARLVHDLREELGVEVRLRDLFTAPVVSDLAARLDSLGAHRAEPDTSSLVALNDGTAGSLHLVHPASGSVFCYTDLARALDGTVAVAAFQAVGVEEDVPPLTSIMDMARHYVDALRAHRPEGPYLLGGWCVGGLVALEMATLLAADGDTVARLLLVDTHLPEGRPRGFTDVELTYGFVEELAAIAGAAVPLSAAEVATLSPDELAEALRTAGLLPAGTGAAALLQRIAVYRANVRAVTDYLRVPPVPRRLPHPVTVLRAAESPSLLPAWRARIAGDVDERTVPGDHYSMLRDPALGEEIRRLTD
ncbi:non-ribosomal peptide synthetase [Saccharomonospora cyanea]|uniref:Amino acid adenylation enzyme/thioester reductase family protein n=1 Tax=Saccharomonospora cyanea NA-134 TaxID=882082 RepID=H5XCT3_9PSEU|nr:non-ribosomal peptide synthetase [Saccharomonospora cyanea]EHR62327.1 amino acid adenylation enzyme/thioester reductase family protein [Saccharomonospora cyanea NA-134]